MNWDGYDHEEAARQADAAMGWRHAYEAAEPLDRSTGRAPGASGGFDRLDSPRREPEQGPKPVRSTAFLWLKPTPRGAYWRRPLTDDEQRDDVARFRRARRNTAFVAVALVGVACLVLYLAAGLAHTEGGTPTHDAAPWFGWGGAIGGILSALLFVNAVSSRYEHPYSSPIPDRHSRYD